MSILCINFGFDILTIYFGKNQILFVENLDMTFGVNQSNLNKLNYEIIHNSIFSSFLLLFAWIIL